MASLLRAAFLIAAGLWAAGLCGCAPDVSSATPVDASPRIDPDYTSLVIPPNIAPMNFRIQEGGLDYVVKVSSDAAAPLEMHCRDGECRFGQKPWREMLLRNRGLRLYWDVYAKRSSTEWVRFRRITNTVAEEPIDSYIVYRQLDPNRFWATIRGIFQRNLETFETSPIMTLRDGTFTCFNCHAFCQNDPNRFLFHMRGLHPGMVVVMDGKIRKVNTQVGAMWRPLAFASWHPDGIHIAATINQFQGHLHSTDMLFYFDAVELRGDLTVYNVETNSITTSREVFGGEYIHTHPCWSPDGKYIYFVRCRKKELRTDLMRISYDTAAEALGSPETVMAYSQLGKCCSFPRVSPDGRYILHILADKTTYPIHQRSADLYLFDLQTKEFRRLDAANSNLAESFPCWSFNGRWFSFLSNRRNGMSALPYFAYFDAQGQVHKAFLLPQEDPGYYDTFLDTYNVLQLVKSKVTIDPFKLARAMEQEGEPAVFRNPPAVDAHAGTTRELTGPQ